MKFSVSKDKLLEGLSTVQNVVSTRTTLPILSNVLLQASDGEIRLSTTDLDVGVRRSVEAQVERIGATTLPARRLFSIVRELPSSEIYFDVDTKNCASIRSGSSYFKILGLPEEEFPPLARFEDAKIFTIAQKVLKDGLKKTSYAISTDETRYVLNGSKCNLVFADAEFHFIFLTHQTLNFSDCLRRNNDFYFLTARKLHFEID